MRAPRLPGRALAPTSATLRASSIAVTAVLAWPPAAALLTWPPAAAGVTRAAPGGGAAFGGGGHFRRPDARRSARAALAACMPGMPQTPPPAWVAELA